MRLHFTIIIITSAATHYAARACKMHGWCIWIGTLSEPSGPALGGWRVMGHVIPALSPRPAKIVNMIMTLYTALSSPRTLTAAAPAALLYAYYVITSSWLPNGLLIRPFIQVVYLLYEICFLSFIMYFFMGLAQRTQYFSFLYHEWAYKAWLSAGQQNTLSYFLIRPQHYHFHI